MNTDDLEALLTQAQAEAARNKRPNQTVASRASRLAFTDPANWLPTGQVQLVHRGQSFDGSATVETLVGLFDEFKHATSRSARKLIASQRLGEVKPRLEYVTGTEWLPATTLEAKRQKPDTRLQVCEDLVLDMGVSSPAVLLEVQMVGGGIARAVLSQETRFESFTPRTVVILPAGLDVLEALTRPTKERLWAEVQTVLGVKPQESVEEDE